MREKISLDTRTCNRLNDYVRCEQLISFSFLGIDSLACGAREREQAKRKHRQKEFFFQTDRQ